MVSRFALLIALLISISANAATRIGNWTVVQQSTDPFSQGSIATPATAELLVVGTCMYDTGAPVFTSITYGGVALTLQTRATTDAAEQTGIYTQISPSAGTQTLAIDHASAIDEGMHVFYAFFEDVDIAGTPVTNLGTAINGASNQTVVTPNTVAAQTGDIAVGIGCVFGTDGVALTGEVLDDTVFNANDGAVGEIAGSGANVAFTLTSGDFPSVSGIVVENAVGGAATAVTVISQVNP